MRSPDCRPARRTWSRWGGPLRATIRCNLCLMKARPGTYALAVTFFASEDDYEPWEEAYLDVGPLKPVPLAEIPVRRKRSRRDMWTVGERS